MTIDILNTYYMMGLWEGLSPVPQFFRDRYFTTGNEDIFAADKVLVEFQNGDHGMAPFMVERAEPIPVDRNGYEIHDYAPTCIKQSRMLTMDELKKRGFGEAILSESTEAERASRLVMKDLEVLENRFARSEEQLCVNTMLNNGFIVNEMIDANTVGNVAKVIYYDPRRGNDGLYTVSAADQWKTDTEWRTIVATVRNMCRSLSGRGLPHTDLIIGQAVADVLLANTVFQKLLDRNSGIVLASPIVETLSAYDGVTLLGNINFGGYNLNVIVADEQYDDGTGILSFFPAKGIMVTAPGAGRLMYAHITHLEESGEYTIIKGRRVPDLYLDRRHKTRELVLESRPLAAPKNYSPWVYAPDVIA